jgi:hypothetical protein
LGIVTGAVLAASVALPLAATAASYPPATYGEGQVDRSVVHPGECVHFSGGGYRKNAQLAVTDNGDPSARGKADGTGNFRIQVCFSTDATLGSHRLEASGTGENGAPRYVTATVTVVGLSESVGSSTSGGEVAGGSAAGAGSGTANGGSGSAGGSATLPNTNGTASGSGSAPGGASSGGPLAGPTQHASSATPWPLIGGLAAAMVLVVGASSLTLVRRARRKAGV